ncbi:MAG: hypothetical protein RLN82_03685 [Pseudomonadales bacterium]
MKKVLITLLGFVMAPMVAVAQPDFSGSWKPDTDRSEPAPSELYRYGHGGSPEPVNQSDLRVEQDGNTIEVYEDAIGAAFYYNSHTRILSRYAVPAVYIADGQERTVTIGSNGVTEQDMTASWEDNKLVIEIEKPWGSNPGNVMLNTREEWMLSPDGDTLYITMQHNWPAENVAYTLVYNRQ